MRRTNYLTDLFATIFDTRHTPAPALDGRPIVAQCKSLMSTNAEASTLRLASSILATYQALSPEEKIAFFDYLANDLDVDASEIIALAAAYREDPTTESFRALQHVSEPTRHELFRRLNQAEGATAQLVSMRRDLLDLLADHPVFGRIDLDFVHLFTSWFNRGFLVLRRINWTTSAKILEKIIAYEAVHEINDWDDLRRRIQPPDRRCYAYFHPRVPDDPLIFVEVALTRGVPVSIHDVLAEGRAPLRPDEPDTAVFYSISNCQRGLFGISFGNSLIKQVVADLSDEFPGLKTFITLSPIPGLIRWLQNETAGDDPARARILDAVGNAGAGGDQEKLHDIAQDLRELAATYLATAKRADGYPKNPVARFHLANGAEIDNVLALADLSANGLAQSGGAMVNYRYDLKHVERNSERFAAKQTVTLSRAVRSLVRTRAKTAVSEG